MKPALLLLTLLLPLSAQAQRKPSIAVPAYYAHTGVCQKVAPFRCAPSVAPGKRNSVIAAIASLYIPGLGSAYAGNGTHFLRHIGIAAAALLTFALAVVMPSPLGPVVFYAAAGAYTVNWGWSVVTAVQDVQTRNATITAERQGITLARIRF